MDAPLDDHLLEEIHADQNTNTGIENKKLIMWLFLASDCMFFGTLISTHLIYRKLYPFGHPEEGAVNITGTFDIELTSFSTFILLMSSFLMALAVSAMHKGSVKSFRRYTFGVILFGLIFLGGQVYEFQHFYHGQGWYEWKAKNDVGLIVQGSEGNGQYFHDVADAGHAKENFLHEHLGLKLKSFKPVKGTRVSDRPVAFSWEIDLPDEIGNVPETFHGQYLYNPENPGASEIVVLSDIPEQPGQAGDSTSESDSADETNASEQSAPPVAEKKPATTADHHEHTLPTGPVPAKLSAMKDVARNTFQHQNFGFHLESFEQVKQVPGLSLQNSVFGSTFYVMTGTHGTHVAIGVLWLFSMLIYSYSGRLTPRNAIDVEIAGLYWHFVDIVWIVIFTAVYLVEYI